MKYFVYGDVHSTHENCNLEELVLSEGADVLIYLGDDDSIQSQEYGIVMRNILRQKGIEVYEVPGNHDQAIYQNIPFRSTALRDRKVEDLHEQALDNEFVSDYLSQVVDSSKLFKEIMLDSGKYLCMFRTAVLHGAFDGDTTSEPYKGPKEFLPLWTRLFDEEDYLKNFEKMNEQKYRVMLRGHDHRAVIASMDAQRNVQMRFPHRDSKEYVLYPDKLHTINPGPFYDGKYVIIDTNQADSLFPVVQFKQI